LGSDAASGTIYNEQGDNIMRRTLFPLRLLVGCIGLLLVAIVAVTRKEKS
jgi:hypothetical protein